jgi:hypothetical protein
MNITLTHDWNRNKSKSLAMSMSTWYLVQYIIYWMPYVSNVDAIYCVSRRKINYVAIYFAMINVQMLDWLQYNYWQKYKI